MEMQGAPRQRLSRGQLQIGVGQIDAQQRVVLVDRGAQQQRSHPPDLKLEPRQVSRVLKEDPLLAEAYRLDVAVAVEDGQGIAVEQGEDACVGE
jgi:hypothetical protein